jgi:hypothetical protein
MVHAADLRGAIRIFQRVSHCGASQPGNPRRGWMSSLASSASKRRVTAVSHTGKDKVDISTARHQARRHLRDPFLPSVPVRQEQGCETVEIRLVDGSYPREPDIGISDVRKLTLQEAWHWRRCGPQGTILPVGHRCWYKR